MRVGYALIRCLCVWTHVCSSTCCNSRSRDTGCRHDCVVWDDTWGLSYSELADSELDSLFHGTPIPMSVVSWFQLELARLWLVYCGYKWLIGQVWSYEIGNLASVDRSDLSRFALVLRLRKSMTYYSWIVHWFDYRNMDFRWHVRRYVANLQMCAALDLIRTIDMNRSYKLQPCNLFTDWMLRTTCVVWIE